MKGDSGKVAVRVGVHRGDLSTRAVGGAAVEGGAGRLAVGRLGEKLGVVRRF